ncbi:hypothetical protein [Streptomyces sp. NPDC054975]
MMKRKSLPTREPFEALAAIVPPPAAPAPVNLFGAKLGDTFDRRFDPARLCRLGALPAASEAQEKEATS